MGIKKAVSSVYLVFLILFFCSAFTACGSGGGGSASQSTAGNSSNNADSAAETSPLLVSLTDAEGDFLRYEVGVSSITLIKANGARVDLLAREARVDFAQYVELSELLTTLEAPVGVYESAAITLDYSDANIVVQDAEGNSVEALAINADGEVLTSVDVEIDFAEREGFAILPGVPRHLAIDFDLDESNQISFTPLGANVTVEPVLYVDSAHASPKSMRVRGLITDVDIDQQKIDIALRPFQIRRFAMGQGSVHIDANTAFEVNGQTHADIEGGMQAVEALGAGAALVALGGWHVESQSYIATHIFAGSSVPWGQADIVSGTVIARNGLTLSLRAVSAELLDGEFNYFNTLDVQLSEDTRVNLLGAGSGSLSQISVGSVITATGSMEAFGFDAASGVVRVSPTQFSANVNANSSGSGELVVDIHLLNGLRPGYYDFSGTGVLDAEDAQSDTYQVNVNGLNTVDLQVDDPVRIRGWVSSFGEAPSDFMATSIVDSSMLPAHLNINFESEGAMNIDSSGMHLSLSMELAGNLKQVLRAGIPLELDHSEISVSAKGQKGIYTIELSGRTRLFTDFSSFSAALAFAQSNGLSISKLNAHGYFNGSAGTFESYRCRIVLN